MAGMRESQFWRLMRDEFGENYSEVLADQLVLTKYQQTIRGALGSGAAVAAVWDEVCLQQDVPLSRRLGRDIEPRPSSE